jgi:hypothetical protein
MKRAWDWAEVLLVVLGISLVGCFTAAMVLFPV